MGKLAFRTVGKRPDDQLMFAADVGRIGDRAAVGRKSRVVFVGVAAGSQITGAAAANGRDEDVPSRGEGGQLAVGRQAVLGCVACVLLSD